jgi:AraC-like DNA-binding protein
MTQKIVVEDLFVEDIVKEMAKSMHALYAEEHNTTKVIVPDEFGSGNIEATQFASGLGIIDTDYNLSEDFIIKMQKHKVNPLKFVYNLGDTFYHRFENEGEFEGINKYSGAIIGSSIEKVHTFKIPKEKNIYFFSIELNRNLFEHKLQRFKFDLGDDLSELLRDVKAINPFFYTYPFGADEFDQIKKITKNEKKGFIGSLFKEGITYTLLSNTLEQYMGKKCDDCEADLASDEVDTVLEISSFIEKNLNNLPTIEEIARRNFISESKLQKLFQSYYKCSVNDFTRNKRLNQARILLETTKLSMAEIAHELGIKSNSYLSKTFKERYGVTPSNYRDSRLSKIRFY